MHLLKHPPLTKADRHFAPNIVRTAMAAGRVSDERDQFTSQDKLMQMHIKESRQAPEPGKFERYSSNIIQQIIDDECRRRQLPSDDRGQYVMTTPDGYIIYKSTKGNTYGVAGVPDVFRIKRPEIPQSMRALQAGRGLCMCRAIGTCPLMAYCHPPPCPLCADPLILRYYPTDKQWWTLHDKVKELRETLRLESDDV